MPRFTPCPICVALLILLPAAAPDRQPTSAQPNARPTTQPATRPTTRPMDSADDVMDRLLDTGPAPDRPAAGESLSGDRFSGRLNNASGGGSSSVAPDTAAQRLVREGTYVIDRLGRARQSPDGRGLELVFESDGENRAAAVDAPMLLAPNLNLMAVESSLRDEPDRAMRVTGRVMEYRGRNYLLLDRVVMVRK